jgi:hypothetical protein
VADVLNIAHGELLVGATVNKRFVSLFPSLCQRQLWNTETLSASARSLFFSPLLSEPVPSHGVLLWIGIGSNIILLDDRRLCSPFLIAALPR